MKPYGKAMPFFTKKSGWFPCTKGRPPTGEGNAYKRWLKRLARRLGNLLVKEQRDDIAKHHTG